ncbi:D-2-hydroxyacid dehydrogenase [Bombilactobacillus folatiphilus]|uniref:D-2-hydroxyacid dehydrogenase n=1 Tax=Bombilactobacillus folatiphilus TaxID=2923362 RepID=A0ABY4P8M5_9LACO|nr:D-2-hydroxyacid dehydrogenase [Bombilactobacillus folatiphilus]UQS81960.1 D-2-hydroxyacid dehydrogenase [Bombilactobacillus folatiphilus]
MKILALSVRDDEQAAFTEWKQAHPEIQVDTTEIELTIQTVDQLQGYDGIVIQQRRQIEPEVYPILEQMGIKQITTRTAGYDVIDLKLAAQHHLQISNVPAYSPRSVAELTLTHTMRLIRKQELFDQRVRQQDYRWAGLQGLEVHTLTIGIIGAGRIGGTTAQLFHALGAKVIAYDTKPNSQLNDILTFMSKQEVLQQADVICLHVDLNPTSENLIDEQALDLMKPTAYLINECRGPVVDTAALIAALQQQKLAGAALDTLTGEENFFNFDLRNKELPSDQLKILQAMDNVIITPHIGFYTNMAVKNMVDISLDDVVDLLTHHSCEHLVTIPE